MRGACGGSQHHTDVLGAEHLIEHRRELGVAVADAVEPEVGAVSRSSVARCGGTWRSHTAVGLAVSAPAHGTQRVACSRTAKQYSRVERDRVGMEEMAMIPSAWASELSRSDRIGAEPGEQKPTSRSTTPLTGRLVTEVRPVSRRSGGTPTRPRLRGHPPAPAHGSSPVVSGQPARRFALVGPVPLHQGPRASASNVQIVRWSDPPGLGQEPGQR